MPIINVDLYPTFCDMTGAKRPDQPLDGKSLVPLLRGEAIEDRALFWHFPAYLQSYQRSNEQRDPLFRSRPCSIIRHGEWKLHEYFESGDLELYNLKDDLGETTNLAESNSSKVKELHDKLLAWRKEIAAPVPTEPNPRFDAESEAAAIAKQLRKARKK